MKSPLRKIGQIADSILNPLTGAGSSADPAANMQVGFVALSYEEVNRLYRHYWMARKVIDIPVEDMLKNGRNITSLDGDDLKRYEDEWNRLQVNKHLAEGMKYASLFGGATIIPINDDVELAEEHNARNFVNGRLQRFIVMDAHEMSTSEGYITDLMSPYFRMPRQFQYNGQTIHISNMIICHGEPLPKRAQQTTALNVAPFWGGSKLDYGKEPVINAHAAYDNVVAMLAGNNVDTLKVPGLYNSIVACADDSETSEMDRGIFRRALLYARHKSMHNVAVMDATEMMERHKYDFTGIPSVIHELVVAVSGMSDIPLTRLAGISPGGMNATGESDLQNYYNNIGAKQKTGLRPLLDQLDYYMTLHVFGEARTLDYTINSPETESEMDIETRKAKVVDWLARVESLNLLPESVIVRSLQQNVMPEIDDEFIEALIKEELAGANDNPDTDDDDDDGTDDA